MQHEHWRNRNQVRAKVHPLKQDHPDTILAQYEAYQFKPHTGWQYQRERKSAYLDAEDVVERVHGLFHLFAGVFLQGAPHTHVKVEEEDLQDDVDQEATPGHCIRQVIESFVPSN